MRPLRFGLTILLLLLVTGTLGIACGSSKKSSTPTPVPQITKLPAATTSGTSAATTPTALITNVPATAASVTIEDFQFKPSSVNLKVGGTVIWINSGPSVHTVTADDGSFDSGNLNRGSTFSHTFNAAGTYTYHCSIHPFMTAQIIVQ